MKYLYEGSRIRVFFDDGSTCILTKNAYGKYVEDIAKLCIKYKCKIKNYFIMYDNYSIMKIYSKKFGYFNVYIDNDDILKVASYKKWSIEISRNTNYAVCQNNKKKIRMHRFILGITNKNDIIDHYDRNGLNNMKRNLRVVNIFVNNNNIYKSPNTKTNVVGINFKHNGYLVIRKKILKNGNIINNNKYFSINKYGKDFAYYKALKCRYKYLIKYQHLINRPEEIDKLKKLLNKKIIKIYTMKI